ncbi:hypothetical protein [Bosea sp. 124]|uniref:hypothetical protein n=1 Tax=Bosea sp. 124 TaxID=2135642 RepID=UPI0011B26348|nr:hypothetical protein [Bosea sp. 124]
MAVLSLEGGKILDLEAWCLREADAGLVGTGLKVDEASRVKYAKAIGVAIQIASLTLAELAKGYPSQRPALFRPLSRRPKHGPIRAWTEQWQAGQLSNDTELAEQLCKIAN